MTDFLSSFGVQLLLAVLLDCLFGEVSRWHPLVGFGNLANKVEQFFYPAEEDMHPENRFPPGVLAVITAIIPLVIIIWWLASFPVLGWFIEIAVLYFAIGGCSLAEHARNISRPLFPW